MDFFPAVELVSYFSHVISIDSAAHCISTMSTMIATVGYGSPAPTNVPSQVFTGFFAIYGVCIIAIGLGILGQRILEQQQKAYESRRERAKRRLVHIFASGVESDTCNDEESNSDGRRLNTTSDNHDTDVDCLATLKDALNIVKKVIRCCCLFSLLHASLVILKDGQLASRSTMR